MSTLVPTGPVREHLHRLLDDGMSQAAIVRKSGVSHGAISALLHGSFSPGRPEQKTMQAFTAHQLLAVKCQPSAAGGGRFVLCAPGARFEPVGFHVGRCPDCGQLAPIRRANRTLTPILTAHPPMPADTVPVQLTAPVTAKADRARPGRTAQLPDDLTAALLRACQAIVLRRPVGQLHTLAAEALRVAVARKDQTATSERAAA